MELGNFWLMLPSFLGISVRMIFHVSIWLGYPFFPFLRFYYVSFGFLGVGGFWGMIKRRSFSLWKVIIKDEYSGIST